MDDRIIECSGSSGPLWTYVGANGAIVWEAVHGNKFPGDVPCRLIPGHGKVVHAKLVEAIAKECARIDPEGYYGRLVDLVEAALDGAT